MQPESQSSTQPEPEGKEPGKISNRIVLIPKVEQNSLSSVVKTEITRRVVELQQLRKILGGA
jgi:hypothetical protein